MSSMSSESRRPRIMSLMKAALVAREPLIIDPDAPNPIPRTVRISGVLTLLAGALTTFTGGLYILGRHASVQSALDQIALCKSQGVGVGTAVAAADTSDLATTCRALIDATPDDVAAALSSLLMTGVIASVLGVGLLVGGWGVLRGGRWARRLAIVIAAVLLIGTMMSFFAHMFLFVAALLMMIALAMVYVGKGGTYYIRAKAQGVR